MINEAHSINNSAKIFTKEILTLFKNKEYSKIINLSDSEYNLYNLNVSFVESNKYYSLFNPTNFKFKNNTLSNIILYFEYPQNYDLNEIEINISHELNHLIEFYNIVKSEGKLPFNISLNDSLMSFRKKYNNMDILGEFTYFVYLSLDNELNARVSQTYNFLRKFKIADYDILRKEIEKSESWNRLLELKNFDSLKLLNYLKNKYSLSGTIAILNILNSVFIQNNVNSKYTFINKILKNEEDLLKYLKLWERIFNFKTIKYKDKLLKIIYEVIKDVDGLEESYRKYCSSDYDILNNKNILDFKEFLKNN